MFADIARYSWPFALQANGHRQQCEQRTTDPVRSPTFTANTKQMTQSVDGQSPNDRNEAGRRKQCETKPEIDSRARRSINKAEDFNRSPERGRQSRRLQAKPEGRNPPGESVSSRKHERKASPDGAALAGRANIRRSPSTDDLPRARSTDAKCCHPASTQPHAQREQMTRSVDCR